MLLDNFDSKIRNPLFERFSLRPICLIPLPLSITPLYLLGGRRWCFRRKSFLVESVKGEAPQFKLRYSVEMNNKHFFGFSGSAFSQSMVWRFARDWRHHRRYLEASIIPVGFCTGDLPPIQNTSCQYYPAKPFGGGQWDALHWVFCQVRLFSIWNWQTFPIWVGTNLTAYNCTVFNPTSPKHLFFVTSTLCSGSVKVSLRCKTAWQARFSNCYDFIVIFSVTPEDSKDVGVKKANIG